jgi:lysophospholipase L1-like esterase
MRQTRGGHGTGTTRMAVVAALAMLAAGCSGSSSEPSPSPTTAPSPSSATTETTTSSRYVALGDSYTAGPGIDPQQPDGGLCQRSAESWPMLLAASLDLRLTDVSCSGATTSDLRTTVASGAVPSDARLVTVGAGGNDGGLFISLLRTCTRDSQKCQRFVDDQAPAILARTTDDLAALLTAVRSKAPRARTLLVGYPRIMPSSGTCQAVAIPPADVAAVVSAETALDRSLTEAARRAGVTYVSLRRPSEGHDACAGGRAWTNGVSPASGDGIVFHPNARGMAAIADVVAGAARG